MRFLYLCLVLELLFACVPQRNGSGQSRVSSVIVNHFKTESGMTPWKSGRFVMTDTSNKKIAVEKSFDSPSNGQASAIDIKVPYGNYTILLEYFGEGVDKKALYRSCLDSKNEEIVNPIFTAAVKLRIEICDQQSAKVGATDEKSSDVSIEPVLRQKTPIRSIVSDQELKDAKQLFTSECAGCHLQLKINDAKLEQIVAAETKAPHKPLVDAGKWPKDLADSSDDGVDQAQLRASAMVQNLKGKSALRTAPSTAEKDQALIAYNSDCRPCHNAIATSQIKGKTLTVIKSAGDAKIRPVHQELIDSKKWPIDMEDKTDDGIDQASLKASALVEILK